MFISRDVYIFQTKSFIDTNAWDILRAIPYLLQEIPYTLLHCTFDFKAYNQRQTDNGRQKKPNAGMTKKISAGMIYKPNTRMTNKSNAGMINNRDGKEVMQG